ncbi:MAG: PIG-L family deacetylase [Candidatus Latescibacterota bacterium]
MAEPPIRIMVFGAHPDDCEARAGGLALKHAALGNRVRFVSVTNGDAGHHLIGGVELARRRRGEAEAVSRLAGVEYEVFDLHDGELEPSLENRKRVIRAIRRFRPDLVLTHRPHDYHPDHRYTSILVQDALFLVTVPNLCTDVEIAERMPVAAYLSDAFQRPYPFTPAVAIDIDDVVERKLDMLHCHVSQMYEWLPFNAGRLEEVPQGDGERRAWLAHRLRAFTAAAERCRSLLVARYGEERGRRVQHAEEFEACEYGSPLTPEAARLLFPF